MGRIFSRNKTSSKPRCLVNDAGDSLVSEFDDVGLRNQAGGLSDDSINQRRLSTDTVFVPNLLQVDDIRLPPICDVDSQEPIYTVAVAMDFGTSFSGYAYSYKDNPNKIFLNKNWGAEYSKEANKTPTSVCIDKSEGFRGFGYNAHAQYQNEESNDDFMLFQKFKMQLHEKRKTISSGLKLTSDEGKSLDGKKVFAQALKYLKEHFLEEVLNKAKRISSEDEVLWVLTVPAIWSDQAKMFMREAAVQAGLVSDTSSNKLVIALEPEAASFYCRSLNFNLGGEMRKLKEGDKYMVIDAGGGTVDVAVHKIESNGSCVEIHEPTGLHWGGDRVNDWFEKLLSKVLGERFVEKFKSKYPQNWFDLKYNFEIQKVGYTDFNKPISVPTDFNIHDCYGKLMDQSLINALKNTRNQGLWLNNAKQLQIGGKQLKEIYDEAVHNIIEHIQGLAQKETVADIKAILLIGGFGSCNYLFDAINTNFKGKYIVLHPEEPSLAVVRGAALFGHRPDFIRTRISPCTYSVMHHGDIPDSNIDMKRISGRFYKSLKPIIRKGEQVEINTIKLEYGMPAEDHMNIVEIELFASETESFDDNPLAESNNAVGKVKVKCPQDLGNRAIAIYFIFGGTCIRVRAETSDGGETEAIFRYDN